MSSQNSSYYGSDLVRQLNYKYGDFASMRDTYKHLLPPSDDESEETEETNGTVDPPGRSGLNGANFEEYYRTMIIPAIIRDSKSLMMPPDFTAEMQALTLCQENEFYLSNQKETLKRLETENQKQRQEMAKQKLIEKSNQFKTKQKENEQPKALLNDSTSSEQNLSNDEQNANRANNSAKLAPQVIPKESNENIKNEIIAKNGLLFKNIQSKLNEHAQSSKVAKPPSLSNLVNSKTDAREIGAENSESSLSQDLHPRSIDYELQNSGETSGYVFANQQIQKMNNGERDIAQNERENNEQNSRTLFKVADRSNSRADFEQGNKSGSISTPVPFLATGSGNNKGSGNSSQSELKPQPRPISTQFINYSEFEDNTTPFDTVAIQSVNDLKELEKIFMTKSESEQNNGFQSNQRVFNQLRSNNYSANQANQIYANPVTTTQGSVGLSGYTNMSNNYYQPANTKSSPISQTGTAPNSFSMQNTATIDPNSQFANQNYLTKRSSVPAINHDSYLSSNLTPQQGINHNFPAGQRNVNGLSYDLSAENKNPQVATTTTANFQSSAFSAYLPLTRHFAPQKSSNEQSLLNYQRYQNTSTSNQIAASGATANAIQIPFKTSHHDDSVGSIPSGANQVADGFGNHVISGPRSLSPRIDNPLDPNKSTQNTLSNPQYMPNGAMSSNLLTNSNQLSTISSNQTMTAQTPFNNTVKMVQNGNNIADQLFYSSAGSFGTGMKPAKSMSDLTSCVPAASLSDERKPDFNVYLPMSSYLAMKK